MTSRYRSDRSVMRAAVRSVPRSNPDPTWPERKDAPPTGEARAGSTPSLWRAEEGRAQPGVGWAKAPVQPPVDDVLFAQDSLTARMADTGSALRGRDISRIASFARTSEIPPPIGHVAHDRMTNGDFTASPRIRPRAALNPHAIREPFHIRHPMAEPERTVPRGPRHRAASRTHPGRWMTLVAVAVAFLAGTTIATLDRSTEQASPQQGSSVGGSTAVDGPRDLSLEPLHPAVSDNANDGRPAIVIVGQVAAVASEPAHPVQIGNTHRGAGDTHGETRVRQADNAPATPVSARAAETAGGRDCGADRRQTTGGGSRTRTGWCSRSRSCTGSPSVSRPGTRARPDARTRPGPGSRTRRPGTRGGSCTRRPGSRAYPLPGLPGSR